MSEDRNALSEFERALARLTPSAALDRDRVIFEAGARDARRRWFARVPFAAALAVGLGLGWWLNGAANPVRETIRFVRVGGDPVEMPQPVEFAAPVEPLDPSSYAALQRRLLSGDFGVTVAFAHTDAPMTPRSLGEQRREMLRGEGTP
jgi:hypothetical protein